MSRLSRLNAFRGTPRWFFSSCLTLPVCQFCSRSLHATDPSYKLPKPHSKKIKQRKNEVCIHSLQRGCFSCVRGSASGNLATTPAVWHMNLLGEHRYLLVLAASASAFLTFVSYFVIPFSPYTVILYLACQPSTIISFRLVGSHITNIFAAQETYYVELMPKWYFLLHHNPFVRFIPARFAMLSLTLPGL